MRGAKKQCKKTYTSGNPWSSSLVHAGRTVLYWKYREKQVYNISNLTDKIINNLQEYTDKLDIQDTFSSCPEYVQSNLNEAWNALRIAQKDVKKLRQDFLEELADQIAYDKI